MADETPKTVTVEATEYHTYMGQEYQIGDTYEIDEQYAESVVQQGKATRVERGESAAKAEPKASHPVAPMTTTSMTTDAAPADGTTPGTARKTARKTARAAKATPARAMKTPAKRKR